MRPYIVNVLLIIGSLLCTFALGEVIARAALPPHKTIHIDVTQKNFSLEPSKEIEDSTGSIIQVMDWSGSQGVRLNPNVSALIRSHTLSKNDIRIQTNSLGLRYPELSQEKGLEKRILFIGDSITFGDYLSEEKTIPNLLEQQLAQRQNPNTKVINAGLPGANTSDEFHHYLELKDSVKPDLVLVGMYLNDAQESQKFYARRLSFPFSKSRLLSFINDRLKVLEVNSILSDIRPGEIDPEWREEFRAGRSLMSGDMLNSRDAFDYEIYNAHKDFGLAWNRLAWKNLSNITNSFGESVMQNESAFALVLFPIHIQVFGSDEIVSTYPQKEFKVMCEELNIRCLDLLPSLKAAASRGMTKDEMYYDHCHLREAGNRVVAEAIHAWLSDGNLIN